MKSEHTPGPWRMEAPREMGTMRSMPIVALYKNGDFRQEIGLVHEWTDLDDEHPQSDANARLIVAAPDLLAVCKIVSAGIWRDKERNACGLAGAAVAVHAIEAAIAKAEGRADARIPG